MKTRPRATAYRRLVRPFHPLAFLAALSLGAPDIGADLVNRYSFNHAAGVAGAGTTITDSVGGANGTIVGFGGAFTGSSLSLPGGAGGSTAAYVDLPNGLLSVHNTVTFEAWYTIGAAPQVWGRIWDFGSTAGGEITGSGGGGEGQDYFLYAPNHGTNINLQRNAVRNLDAATLGSGTAPVVAGEQNRDGNLVSASGQQYHVVSVWEQSGTGGVLTLYRDGTSLGSTNTTFNATDINDVNNWLGRSNWTGDSYFQGEFNEFRIYDEALDAAQVAATFAAGPDALIDFGADSDGDMMPNVFEELYPFLDPNDPGDAGNDEEPDGLTNLQEFNLGTRPDMADTDADGLTDGEEVNTHGTNPLLADTDGDSLSDGDEVNVHLTSPTDPDSDDDLLPDGYEVVTPNLDPNNPADAALDLEPDGLDNIAEFGAGSDPNVADTDADGLTDGDEVNTHLTNPTLADTDGDTLSDGDEVTTTGTSPLLADTDGDGLRDNIEIHNLLDPNDPVATLPVPLHRYSFSEPAGAAAAGAGVADLIGGANGIVVGDGANFTGFEVGLPGGAGGSTAAYIDLPNGLLSPHETVTFEAWFTLTGVQAWGRVWDFGSSVGGEVPGSGGGGEGQDYFIYAPNHGTDINLQRYTARNLDAAAPGGGMGPVDGDEEPLDTNLATNLFQQYHVAGVWAASANGGGQLTIYRDGVNQGSRTTTFNATDINDVNNWLGRSNWTGDSYFQGNFNEFRIYEGAMNNAAAAASFSAGPDVDLGGAPFRIIDFTFDPLLRSATFTWNSVPGALYAIDASGDPLFWIELNDGVMSQGSETSYTETDIPLGEATRFYRVRRLP